MPSDPPPAERRVGLVSEARSPVPPSRSSRAISRWPEWATVSSIMWEGRPNEHCGTRTSASGSSWVPEGQRTRSAGQDLVGAVALRPVIREDVVRPPTTHEPARGSYAGRPSSQGKEECAPATTSWNQCRSALPRCSTMPAGVHPDGRTAVCHARSSRPSTIECTEALWYSSVWRSAAARLRRHGQSFQQYFQTDLRALATRHR